MNHRIYTGSFAALETRWVEAVAELRREDPLSEINVLVGSNVLASHLKRRSARSGKALVNVRFHTFLDLVRRLALESGTHPRKNRMPPMGTSIILGDILASGTPDVFAPLGGFQGFRDAIEDTFRDLRDAGVTPETLERSVVPAADMKARRRSLAALADLYRRYREKAGAYHDVDDDFRAAVSGLRSRAASRASAGRALMVYGIYDVTGQQSQLLAALKDTADMQYFIPYVDETVSEFATPFLRARVRELGVERIPVLEPSPRTCLDHMALSGFGLTPLAESARARMPESDGSCRLVSVPGESRSAVEIVREIVRAVQDGTIGGFDEAAVILRQPETDIPVLSEMLRLRGIPCYIHGGVSFADRPVSRAVVAVLDLESQDFSRESVLAAMELTAAALPDPQASSWDVATWRALTSHPRFLAGAASWDAGVEALVDRAARDLEEAGRRGEDAGLEDTGVRGALTAEAAARRLGSARSLRDGWRSLRRAAGKWPEKLSWKEWASLLYRRLEPLLGSCDEWPAFAAVLDQIGNLQVLASASSGGTPVPLDGMKQSLLRSIGSMVFPAGRFRSGGVNILSTSAARGLRFPLVIMPGLDEGRFPAKLRQDPLLPDSERASLKNLPLKKKRMEEERLLFDMAARSAGKRLVLMTTRLDESSDRERIPSQFFLRAAAAVRGGIVSLRDLNRETVPGFRSVSLDNPAPLPGEPAVDEAEIRLRLIVSGEYPARAAMAALARMEPQRFTGPLAYDRARWERSLTPYDGCLDDPALVRKMARSIESHAGQVSASRVEAYAKCPYYYFLKHGMGLEAWEEPEPSEGLDPLERGILVHSILEGFLKEHPGKTILETPEGAIERALEALAGETFRRSRPAAIPALLWDIECDALLALLRNWLDFEKKRAHGGLLPAGLECVFGEFPDGERLPALGIRAGKHRFNFRGRIDRVDVSADGMRARVVDYKTGALPPTMAGKSRTPLMGGERIQLAVYRSALKVLGAFASVESVEGEYLYLQPADGRIAPCAFTGEELEKAASLLPGVLEIIGDGMESGTFFARTGGSVRPAGHCDYCDYLMICGKDRVQREARKSGDPRVHSFLRIIELDRREINTEK